MRKLFNTLIGVIIMASLTVSSVLADGNSTKGASASQKVLSGIRLVHATPTPKVADEPAPILVTETPTPFETIENYEPMTGELLTPESTATVDAVMILNLTPVFVPANKCEVASNMIHIMGGASTHNPADTYVPTLPSCQ